MASTDIQIPVGPTGYTGYTGPGGGGPTGDTGPTGPAGLGSTGYTGYTGYTGPGGAGSIGPTGYTGYTGADSNVTGPTGYTGPNGNPSYNLSLVPFQSDQTVLVGLFPINVLASATLNGKNVTAAIAGVGDAKGVTGTTSVQIVRRRAGSDVDVLSTPITIGDEWFASDGVIDTGNDDVLTGDSFLIEVTGVHTTPPEGLTVTITIS